MAENIFKLKQQMCEIGRNIWLKGFCAGNEGNHSVRLDDKRVLCTPTGISKGFLTPDMICTVDMEGNQLDHKEHGYKRTSEILVHLAIYKKRPDIKAVIHSHPPHATAFAIAQIPIPEGIHPEAEVFLGRVPTAPYATPSKQDLPNSILPLIGPETNTVMMGNHGSVSFSRKGLVDTYYLLEILDAYCRILLLTKQLGHANVLNPQQMAELLEVKQKFGMKDDRLACAATGCVGAEQNQDFFASFDVRPCCASCGEGGTVQQTGSASDTGMSHDEIERLVQTITDQIMATAR